MAAALAVTGVFGWAAVAKLVSRKATESAFRSLRVPSPAAASVLVPGAELGIGALTFARPQLGCVAAVSLLIAFTMLLGWHVVNRSEVRCGCFGSAGSEPVSWVSLVRNGGLILLSLVGAGLSPTTMPDWDTATWASSVVCALSFVGSGLLLLSLFTMKQSIGSVFSQSPRASEPQVIR
jgi:hypothetical protein